MNWKEIVEKYPRALTALLNWFSETPVKLHNTDLVSDGNDLHYNSVNGAGSIYFRDLYDFFDEHNLNIHIEAEYYEDGINWCWQIFWFDHTQSDCMNGTGQYGDNGGYGSRTEAETAAFEKAFELLNQKLSR